MHSYIKYVVLFLCTILALVASEFNNNVERIDEKSLCDTEMELYTAALKKKEV